MATYSNSKWNAKPIYQTASSFSSFKDAVAQFTKKESIKKFVSDNFKNEYGDTLSNVKDVFTVEFKNPQEFKKVNLTQVGGRRRTRRGKRRGRKTRRRS